MQGWGGYKRPIGAAAFPFLIDFLSVILKLCYLENVSIPCNVYDN